MKRIVFCIFILCCFTLQAQKKTVQLNSIGLPDYRKLYTALRAFPVYRADNRMFFTVASKHLYNYGNNSKDLTFEVFLDKNGHLTKVQPNTQVSEFTINYNAKNKILSLKSVSNSSKISFDLAYQTEKKHIVFTPLDSSKVQIDTTLGFVTFSNRLIKYNKIPGANVNIALLDKNHNGLTDSEDLLSVSDDNYFFTAVNRNTCKVKNEIYIKVYSKTYKVVLLKTGELEVETLNLSGDQVLEYDIVFDGNLKNIIFDDKINTSLKDVLPQEKYTIINVWSVYCPPCISSLETFNQPDLKDNVVGLTVENPKLVAQFNTKFNNFQINRKQLNELNINGYPSYYIVDSNLKIVGFYRDVEDLLSRYQELTR